MLHSTHTSPCPRPLIRSGLPAITVTLQARARRRILMSALLTAGMLYIAPSAPAHATGITAPPAITHSAEATRHNVERKVSFPLTRETLSTSSEAIAAPPGEETQRLVLAGGLAMALAGLLALILVMMNGTARTLGLRGGQD